MHLHTRTCKHCTVAVSLLLQFFEGALIEDAPAHQRTCATNLDAPAHQNSTTLHCSRQPTPAILRSCVNKLQRRSHKSTPRKTYVYCCMNYKLQFTQKIVSSPKTQRVLQWELVPNPEDDHRKSWDQFVLKALKNEEESEAQLSSIPRTSKSKEKRKQNKCAH